MKPHAMAFITISTAKTKVKTWLQMLSKYLSLDQGGMLGLSMANVMQLADMNVRIMKSNHPCEVRSWQNILILKWLIIR